MKLRMQQLQIYYLVEKSWIYSLKPNKPGWQEWQKSVGSYSKSRP